MAQKRQNSGVGMPHAGARKWGPKKEKDAPSADISSARSIPNPVELESSCKCALNRGDLLD